jgi:tetratricopeptide (TPR) repeat protein
MPLALSQGSALDLQGNAVNPYHALTKLARVRKVEEAVTYLSRALKTRPNYFDARYNLGNALASQDNFAAAAAQFRFALESRADDADAEANLGSALAEMGQFSEAKMHFERAL